MKAIQITEDYLKNCDLESKEVKEGTVKYNIYSIRFDFDIYCYIDKSGNCLFWGESFRLDFFIVKCDKVHKFKSIFRMLTGKKLNIK